MLRRRGGGQGGARARVASSASADPIPTPCNNFERQDVRLAGDSNNDKDKNHNGIDDDFERLRSLALPTSPNAGALTGVPKPPFSPAAGLAGVARPRVRSDGEEPPSRSGRLLNIPTSRGIPEGRATKSSPEAGTGLEPTGEFYSVAFEMKLAPTSYPGVSRRMHNREATKRSFVRWSRISSLQV